MTPQAPDWRRSKGDAVLDAEAMGWDKYHLATTKFQPWTGKTETWYKAVRNGKDKPKSKVHADD